MKKLFLLIGVVMLFSANSFAQTDITELLKAGQKDANTLAQPYLKPFGEMLGKGLNNGWYTSAKPHKLLGFDLTFTASYIKAPSSALSFDVSQLELSEFEHVPTSSAIAPTVAGDIDDLPKLRLKDDITGLSEFDMPNGTGMDFLPIPMISAGVGLPYGFEIKGRFIPKVEIGDAGKLNLWGLGLQKDIKDYIPGVKHVPVLNVSVLAAYTKFASELQVDDPNFDGHLDISANGLTTRLLIGANLPVVAFYTGLGYGKSSSDFDLLGVYRPTATSDPISLAYSTTGFDMNVGMRIRLGVIALHADYTLGDYSSITAGLGISFR
ncbi:hypothetical protein SAMN06265379_10169 [Saccharicrinis carchari]|uniref:MetA-pathway of phenol degradation n=1 Tax=Saccharicrinis carchari TaxID=1168039 RepID=A0A521AE85_SACCC|nr:DUF6588 family protein [Saccharicrinis carchari]SMO33122.1 hypothetical protein SAMN06265379_10169 [Saccharicrinis carchari]